MGAMAGLCMNGHFALASLPASSKLKASCIVSASCSSLPTISAKTGSKLETIELQQPLKISSSNVDTRSKQFCLNSHTRIKQVSTIAVEPAQNAGQLILDKPMLDMATPTTATDALLGDEHAEMDIGDEKASEEDDREGLSMDLYDSKDVGGNPEMFIPPGIVISEGKRFRKLPGSNIILSPYAKNNRVKQAEFVKSSSSVTECPALKLPEFAMVGRSNVGKSSLINSLVQRKDLAQTSKKPGKTQLINHYIINKSWYLVDLPGYGYAKVPAGIRATWGGFTKEFFLQSKSLVCVMLLVDGSIPPQQIDLEYAAWLRQSKVPLTIVFTKCDRKKKKKNGGRKPVENVHDFLKSLKEQFDTLPPWILTSCVTNQGRDELLMHMSQLRHYWSS